MNAEYARIREYLRAQAAKLEPVAIVDKVRGAMRDLREAAVRVPPARFAERPASDEWSGIARAPGAVASPSCVPRTRATEA